MESMIWYGNMALGLNIIDCSVMIAMAAEIVLNGHPDCFFAFDDCPSSYFFFDPPSRSILASYLKANCVFKWVWLWHLMGLCNPCNLSMHFS